MAAAMAVLGSVYTPLPSGHLSREIKLQKVGMSNASEVVVLCFVNTVTVLRDIDM